MSRQRDEALWEPTGVPLSAAHLAERRCGMPWKRPHIESLPCPQPHHERVPAGAVEDAAAAFYRAGAAFPEEP